MIVDASTPDSAPFRICFVCTGNICRSPMAAAVFAALGADAGLRGRVEVSSAGTGDWHVGEQADERTLEALERRGYEGEAHRARQFDTGWFDELDLVVVFDRSQERTLREWASSDEERSKIHTLLSFDAEQSSQGDVPDPYYSDAAMFDRVLVMVERACKALFRQITPGITQGAS